MMDGGMEDECQGMDGRSGTSNYEDGYEDYGVKETEKKQNSLRGRQDLMFVVICAKRSTRDRHSVHCRTISLPSTHQPKKKKTHTKKVARPPPPLTPHLVRQRSNSSSSWTSSYLVASRSVSSHSPHSRRYYFLPHSHLRPRPYQASA